VDHSEADYKEGLTLAQLMPALAAQLAMYLGTSLRRARASIVGSGFVLPSLLMVVVPRLAVRALRRTWMDAGRFSTASGAASSGKIIAISAYKLTRKNIAASASWGIYLVSATITAPDASRKLSGCSCSGRAVWLLRAPPKWLKLERHGAVAGALRCGSPPSTGRCWAGSGLFRESGAFGVRQRTCDRAFPVRRRRDRASLAGRATALSSGRGGMITPGPVVITVGFTAT